MRFFFFLLFGLPAFLCAQVEVSSSLPARIFLLYEGIPLRLEITNRSGEEIRITEEGPGDKLLLRVQDLQGRLVPRTQLPLLTEPWVIADGETSVRTFDLVQMYEIRRAGSFRGTQQVELVGEGKEGKPLMFEVVNGHPFDEVKRRKTDRIFSIIGINRGGRDELMLRISNYERSTTLSTFFLERHLRFYPPSIRMTSDGSVAVLHYLSPAQVVLCRFEADGKPVSREYYRASAGVPVRLQESAEKGFWVEGAVKMDTPAAETTESP